MSHRAPNAIQSAPNAIRLDGGRNLIGHRTENDDSCYICKPLLLYFY